MPGKAADLDSPEVHHRSRTVIPELDGVRGLAILLVLIVHFGDYSPTHDFFLAKVFRGIVGFGWTGVDLFFVLSGCLITGILLDAKGSPNYFLSFYMRRVLRILPLYYAAVAAYFLAYIPLAHHLQQASGLHQRAQWWFWFYLSNWKLAFDPNIAPPLGHFWTLAIEEQFYLVWPLIVFLLPTRILFYLSQSLVLVALLLRSLPPFQAIEAQYPEFLYNLTPFRIDSLALGACVAIVLCDPSLRAGARKWIGFIAATGVAGVVAAVALGKSVRYYAAPMSSFGYTAVSLAYAGLVAFAVLQSGEQTAFSRALRLPLLRRMGKYSYGIYVLHWPVSPYVDDFFQERFAIWGGLGGAVLSLGAGLLLSFALGLLSWNLFEKHFLRLKRRFPYR